MSLRFLNEDMSHARDQLAVEVAETRPSDGKRLKRFTSMTV